MPQLLRTKLQPPPLREQRVMRPHLYGELGDFQRGVVLVSAPPGFGKSTIVVEWLQAQNRPFAWYSLDQYDGDIGLFAQYLGESAGRLTGQVSSLATLPGDRSVDPRSLIAILVDDLSGCEPGTALVLDDYHEIESREVHQAVNYLVENLPAGLVLVIISRADPPLPLARLRSKGELAEIRGSNLRFSNEEVAEYFRQTSGLALEDGQTQLITERSEGWISALQLASLGMAEGQPQDLAASVTAQHPFIAGYLVDEVLTRLRSELADFLVRTSILERFDAGLCREVAGVASAAELIAEVESENAFLIPLDDAGEWYRYHHLFAELLRSRLRNSDPDATRQLLVAAARACDQRGLADDALGYALKAEDVELAGQILEGNLGAALARGEVARLRSWLRLFPIPGGPASHILDLGWAWCRVFEGNLDEANRLTERVEKIHSGSFRSDPTGQLEVIRSLVAFQAGDAPEAERSAQAGLDALTESSSYMLGLAQLCFGRALHAQARRVEARSHLETAAVLSEGRNTLAATSALFWLGVVDMDLGNLRDAERSMKRAREAGARTTGQDGDSHPAAGIGDIGLAYIRLNQLDPESAIVLAERGSQLLKRSTIVEMAFRAFFVWAEALSVAGRFDEADRVADEGIGWLQGRNVGGGPLETWLMMAKARNLSRRGRLDAAKDMLARVRHRGLGSPNEDEGLGFYEAADAVSQSLVRGDKAESRKLFDSLPTDPTANVMFAIKRKVLEAAVHELEGESRLAVAALESAVEMAHVGYRFQFTFGGPAINRILKRMAGRTNHDEFVRSVIDRIPAETGRAPLQPVDPLTEREVEVLAEIAEGYTNEEIADRLFISRGTVKRHASNIYLKLGAHHRAEAAARGRELGLID